MSDLRSDYHDAALCLGLGVVLIAWGVAAAVLIPADHALRYWRRVAPLDVWRG